MGGGSHAVQTGRVMEAFEPVLVAELGPAWRELFASFDEQATAAASIGSRGSAVPAG